ncbi:MULTISPECIES: hypothetical protein [Microbacterium]|uniref:Uncharacterized protein n=2 Tax=Microbacterium maritypicum TaxID=33918 RepID=A0AAJ6AQH1_MICMQ|nr:MULTISPECIES: hypothetical protein [Microbacterium]EYT57692.1 hypothetical protein D514_0116185 [Microbacterium sp. UCD-TDU]MBP5803713.1 hypothetical protein [Microbacterium liquefaciens]UTT53225.1 hypothetical protein NMQ05_01220 [Microbacterium liquefaciens]WEF21326.1 hypothetical protein PWF71_01270 [Microbacterium liquefaciens]
MVEPTDLRDERYIGYDELLDQLHRRFPAVPRERIARIIVAENDAITGGLLLVVPVEVATGAIEMLERDSGEVVA